MNFHTIHVCSQHSLTIVSYRSRIVITKPPLLISLNIHCLIIFLVFMFVLGIYCWLIQSQLIRWVAYQIWGQGRVEP